MLFNLKKGDRFKEAAKINLSLSSLGNVISALVRIASSMTQKVHIAFHFVLSVLGGW